MKSQTRTRLIIIAAIALLGLGVGFPQIFTREFQFNHWLNKPQQSSFAYDLRLSHGGKWFVVEVAPTYSIASLIFPFTKFQFNELAPVENNFYSLNWSPNQAFLFAVKERTQEWYCARDQFYILEEIDGRLQIKSSLNSAMNDLSECMDSRWLWDGNEIAIFTNPYRKNVIDINVYDMNARLVHSYKYALTQEDTAPFFNRYKIQIYPEHGVSLLSIYSDEESVPYSKIIALYEDEPDKPSHLVDFQGNYQIIAMDKNNERLVLLESSSNQDNYVVYNISTGIVEKKESLSAKYGDKNYLPWTAITSLNKRFTAIRSDRSEQSGEWYLLIWDWETGDFKDYGNIDSLIGWDEEQKAFLVLIRENEDFRMKWVKPE